MRYLIDTNICIYIMNKRPESVIRKFRQFEPGDIGISSISISELQYGVAKSSKPRLNQLRLEEFIAPFEILSYDESASKAYGDIRCALEKSGMTIGSLDMLIAAQAVSQKFVLVTNNEREFSRIVQLKVENWVG